MSTMLVRAISLSMLVILLLASCSGGESGTGAKASNQTTQGVVTGFGSIFVNGVEYNTDLASVAVDGLLADEGSLSVGKVVTIIGSVDNNGKTGSAQQVSSNTAVQGMIFQNNVAVNGIGTLDVMGQTVHVNSDTWFKPENSGATSVDMLIPGTHVVQVSGYMNYLGDIYATYLKVIDNTGTVANVIMHGNIRNYTSNSAGGNFKLGNMSVNFDGLTQFDDGLTPAMLVNDLTISLAAINYSGTGPVTASVIKREDRFNEPVGEELEFEGVVTDVSQLLISQQFELNARVVHFNTATTIIGGSETDIMQESFLEVEGQVQADGSIVAEEIAFRIPASMQIIGSVMSVTNNTLTINDTADTKAITVSELTKYEDETNEQNRYFNFNDITPGMNLKVKFYSDPVLGVYIASSVEKVL